MVRAMDESDCVDRRQGLGTEGREEEEEARSLLCIDSKMISNTLVYDKDFKKVVFRSSVVLK